MKRRHKMPFGAECRDDGKVRFRLWAPSAREVEVIFENTSQSTRLPLERQDHGWFELITDAAKPRNCYRYCINRELEVPDPASRFQPNDVHGASEVIDPLEYEWRDENWRGRPWKEAVIYELHVGTFTPGGTFDDVAARLDHLVDLGVTAVEIMPVADFCGRRNWGYDGVLPFAPDSVYGHPEKLKSLIQLAHQRGLMVLLDVVYNHFGPEGNYLHSYAPQFFTDRHHTPWGKAINFDGSESRVVRDFFIHNALYWIHEFHIDGLRLDAVHAILDDSKPHILTELAETVRASVNQERYVHLVLENDLNQAHFLKGSSACKKAYDGQWNDDIHHTLHVLLTGETDGYYSDYSNHPREQLGRCLTEGFAYQGDISMYRNGKPRGEVSRDLPSTAFVSFLQNHDQVGNRAFGERINTLADERAIRAAAAILLLAPSPPLLFMGEEFGTKTPFLYFCNYADGLAEAVAAGRRNEFARFAKFSNPEVRAGIPDPNAEQTFASSKLNWSELDEESHREWFRFHQHLLRLRCRYIVPLISTDVRVQANYQPIEMRGLKVDWRFADGPQLSLLANLSAEPLNHLPAVDARIIYATGDIGPTELRGKALPPWSAIWTLQS